MLDTPRHAEAAEQIQKLYAAADGPTEAARTIAQKSAADLIHTVPDGNA